MAKILLKRNFDFLFCKVDVCVSNSLRHLGLGESELIDVPNGEYLFDISALGYYSGSKTLQINDDCTIVIKQILPPWFYLSLLSLICLSITLGVLGFLPNIVGSSLLILLLVPIIIASTVKRHSFFSLKVVCKE